MIIPREGGFLTMKTSFRFGQQLLMFPFPGIRTTGVDNGLVPNNLKLFPLKVCQFLGWSSEVEHIVTNCPINSSLQFAESHFLDWSELPHGSLDGACIQLD